MGETQNKSKRRKYLVLSCIANLGMLFTFKYFNFFNESFKGFCEWLHIPYSLPGLDLLLPIGISFYTFQTLSYTIDVYRGHQKPERHFGYFALYVAFFPQLVAGPIERPSRLIPQLKKHTTFDYQRVKDGLLLMAWGFFKKLVIADRVAVIVNQVYNHPTEYSGIPLILATYLFAYQIYCDFSGYSDIAIGAAQVMGVNLMKNFDCPYMSRSVSEFWKRWHISLSTWFKDYLYISLGGNRVSVARLYFNLLIVFILSGLWHGANWTFVIWGALHGSYLVISIATNNVRQNFCKAIGLIKFPKIHNMIKTIITFHLVVLGWIFFRANSLSDAIYIISHLFHGLEWKLTGQNMGLGATETLTALIAIYILEILQWVQRRTSVRSLVSVQPIIIRWALYYGLVFCLLVYGRIEANIEFIYFQF